MASRSAASCGEIVVWDVMVSLSWGRMVAAVRRYMKVNFEGKLHILRAASGALFGRR
jgi:hypothetical protein